MKKLSPYLSEFWGLLKTYAPFAALMAIILAALLSQGSWRYFFDTTLPICAKIMFAVWILMSLTAARHRRNTAVGVNGCVDTDSSDDGGIRYNPATGLPMTHANVDIEGNPFGADNR